MLLLRGKNRVELGQEGQRGGNATLGSERIRRGHIMSQQSSSFSEEGRKKKKC